jgi:thiosulfate reductase cytochrome b subunit
MSVPADLRVTAAPKPHAAIVRVTHWVTTLCFVALLVSGIELIISHPRFYWGEDGNVMMPALFTLPLPASRSSVPTGYGYVLPDQNGWSRSLHFQTAWLVVFTGLLYIVVGWRTGHFQRSLVPAKRDFSWQVLSQAIAKHLRFERPSGPRYNLLQQLAYLSVIFVLFPLMIWTGLAMSPGFVSAFPATVTSLGGQQSARTIHFLITLALVAFLLVHVVMICRAGFRSRMQAMITGSVPQQEENA